MSNSRNTSKRPNQHRWPLISALSSAHHRLATPSDGIWRRTSSLINPIDHHTSQRTISIDSEMCRRRIKSSDERTCSRLVLLAVLASLSLLMLPPASNAQHSTNKFKLSTSSKSVHLASTTPSQSESIKWSFGGWAPLNGKPNSTSSVPSSTRQATATSPLPVNRTERSRDALSESASQPRAAHQQAATENAHNHHQHVRQPQQEVHAQAHQHHQVAPYHHEAGAGLAQPFAHAQRPLQPAQLPMQQQQSSQVAQFSPPAPPAIVREHLLPAPNNQHQARPMHQFAAQVAYPPRPMHMQQHHQQRPPHNNMMMMQHPRHQHGRFMRPPMVQGPRVEHQRRMREMELRHRQQAMRHHHMMMQQQQQQQQQQQHRPLHMQPHEGAQHSQAPHQQTTIIHAHQLQGPAANVGAYKLIEGEHPIIFNAPHPEDNSIRMIEVGGNQHQPQQGYQNMSAPSSSAMNAIEKDNLNYQQAMQQVTKSLAEEEQRNHGARQSNNIQEVKQRQLYEQQQQQQQQEYSKHDNSSSKTPYLTVPVAVETDGDKVLTPEDINEIEKHVINVLPNLHTADKVVKIADARLNLANIEGAVQQVQQATAAAAANQHQVGQQASGPELSQMNYAEHKSTMKQLEGDLRQQRDYPRASTGGVAQASRSTHPPPAPSGNPSHSSSAGVSQATTANAHHQAAPEEMLNHQQQQQVHLGLDEQQYFIATGPMQELGSVDPEQVADYNLIKNDLLNKFHYEPTRAGAPGSRQQQQQTASTPPMPYTASQPPSARVPSSTNPTVTRYFHQGRSAAPNHAQRQQNQRDQLFGRMKQQNGIGYSQSPQTSSTRTMMGGRKVSEIMRPLIHTTPIPMSSPMHVPSVEPEKVDAIQFIAGQAANDKQPMVVEAHQLVSHTPDGGIDYSTGMGQPPAQQQQQYQQQQANQSYHEVNQEQFQPHQFVPQANPNEENQQGAIIEYVSISDQALSNALGQQQHSTPVGQQQTYEIASTPEMQPVYVSAEQQQQQQQQPVGPQLPAQYSYSMADQQPTSEQQAGEGSPQQTTPTYALSSVTTEQPQVVLVEHQQQPQQPESAQQPSLAWSPSVASEHQQQQQPLEIAGPMQQLELPATAGYNLFGQPEQQQQQQSTPSGQDYEQQQQQEREPEHHSKWRTRAGGRQPNPDAQYDGQIVRGSQGQEESSTTGEGEQKGEQQHQQVDEQQQQYLSGYSQQPQQQEPQQQQQEQANYEQHSSTPAGGQSSTRDQYDSSTSAFHGAVGGARMNYNTGAGLHYSRPQEQVPYGQTAFSAPVEQQTATTPYGYAKLDRERQQSHLAEQQAQHQAQLAELMQNQQQQQQQQEVEQQPQQYQTTSTPVTLTTMAAAIEQQQQQQAEQQQQQPAQEQQQEQHQQQRYEGEPARQSGDSSQALLINPETPIQVPIMDQQSLIHEQEGNQQDEALTGSSDDGARQRQHSQPAAVYQVYQAYYAPKDHKPLPGYVRLSLEEFNELFKDAEIQFVDKNLNGLAKNLVNQHQQNEMAANNENNAGQQYDHMKASGSEQQTIVVDRRSIADRRVDSTTTTTTTNANATTPTQRPSTKLSAERRLKHLGQAAVKKIISIRNSRQTGKQSPRAETKSSKGIAKRVKAAQLQANKPNASKTGATSSTTTASTFTSASSSTELPSTQKSSPISKSAKKQTPAKSGTKNATSQQREAKRVSIKS